MTDVSRHGCSHLLRDSCSKLIQITAVYCLQLTMIDKVARYNKWSKYLDKGRIAAAHGRFSRIRQDAPMCTPSNTCLLPSTQVHIPNGISIGSAVFAGLVSRESWSWQIDRQTDYVSTSVTIGRICVHSTAMWPNNCKGCSKYTVNHKKRGSLFLTITLANLNRFLYFYIILIVKKFYMWLW